MPGHVGLFGDIRSNNLTYHVVISDKKEQGQGLSTYT